MSPDPVPSDPFLLFVYGTLKRDGVRTSLLAGQHFLGEVLTQPLYALYDLGAYPGMVACEDGGQAVRGELYEVEKRLLPRLDRTEGAPWLFRLAPVLLQGPGPAFAYLYQQPTASHVALPDGVWHNP